MNLRLKMDYLLMSRLTLNLRMLPRNWTRLSVLIRLGWQATQAIGSASWRLPTKG